MRRGHNTTLKRSVDVNVDLDSALCRQVLQARERSSTSRALTEHAVKAALVLRSGVSRTSCQVILFQFSSMFNKALEGSTIPPLLW